MTFRLTTFSIHFSFPCLFTFQGFQYYCSSFSRLLLFCFFAFFGHKKFFLDINIFWTHLQLSRYHTRVKEVGKKWTLTFFGPISLYFQLSRYQSERKVYPRYASSIVFSRWWLTEGIFGSIYVFFLKPSHTLEVILRLACAIFLLLIHLHFF